MDNGSSSVVRENDDDDTNGNVVTMTMMVSEDQLPYVILHGNDANLSALRPTASNTNNSNNNSEGEGGGEEKEETTLSTSATSTTYFNQRSEPPIMSNPIHCRLKCNFDSPSSLLSSQKSESDVAEAKHNENEEKEEIVETESEGLVFISSNQVCFVETTSTTTATRNSDETQQEPRDIAIGATCITLHAMTEEPELAIYLQVSSSDSNDDDNNNNINQEVTIVPFDPNSCQILFDKLCKLVSNHPLDVDDDNNEDDGGYGGGYDYDGGGGGLMSFMGGLGEGGNTGDDDVIWAPSGGFVDPEQQHKRDGDLVGGQAEEATDEERDAMLERLDNLLIINPEYETQDGQFDDAAEDEN